MRHRVTRALSAAALVAAFVLVLNVSAASASVDVERESRITSNTVGPVSIGASIEGLRESPPAGVELSPATEIAPGVTGHVVLVGGVPSFAIAAAPGTDEVGVIVVFTSRFRTGEGIGPGSSLDAGRDAYGFAELTRTADLWGREAARFNDGPPGVLFVTAEVGTPAIGSYRPGASTTAVAPPASLIRSVIVGDLSALATQVERVLPDAAGPDAGSGDTASEDTESANTTGPTTTDAEGPVDEPSDETAAAAPAAESIEPLALAETGTEQLLLVSVAAAALLLGGVLALVHRRYLAPAWLRSNVW